MESANTNDDFLYSSFASFLANSPRVLCLVGAGLSAPSGLATWRGSNGLWNNTNLKELASPKKFEEDPITAWRFYGERVLEALTAQPNAAHYALAALAGWHGDWLTVNQNVDGLLERTDHPASRLLSIHGTLRAIRCTACEYSIDVQKPEDVPFLVPLVSAEKQDVALSDLPHCPGCASLLRPGVVWFGERLAAGAPDRIDEWVEEEHIDLVIAAGTSLEVFPAAEWVHTVREWGASLAIIDANRDEELVGDLDDDEWFFEGDVATILPKILSMIT